MVPSDPGLDAYPSPGYGNDPVLCVKVHFMLHRIEDPETIIISAEYQAVIAYMMVHHKVRDFGAGKPFFDRHESTWKVAGSKGSQVFQNTGDPTDVFILFEWDSMENLKKIQRLG